MQPLLSPRSPASSTQSGTSPNPRPLPGVHTATWAECDARLARCRTTAIDCRHYIRTRSGQWGTVQWIVRDSRAGTALQSLLFYFRAITVVILT